MEKNLTFVALLLVMLTGGWCCGPMTTSFNEDYISYEVDLETQALQLYWKDDRDQAFRSIGKLKSWIESKGQKLIFAMNAGMYRPDHAPQGLLIQEYRQMAPLDTFSGSGNFYLKPNGVFYTTRDKRAFITTTAHFRIHKDIQWATQSGPMLLINGQFHPALKEGSQNLNIRNGVGILPDGNVVFAMSAAEVNLYDFAKYFKDLGRKDALYLDGLVSRTCLPEQQWVQTDGNFGAIIAVTEE